MNHHDSVFSFVLFVANSSRTFKTERGSVDGSGRAYNLSRQICIVSSRQTDNRQNRPRNPTITVLKKETILILPYLGAQSKIVTKQLNTCINRFYGCIDLKVIFQSAHRIKSFLSYKDKINRSQMSKVVYKASCWDCQDFYIGKTKRRLHFKGITSACHASAIAYHVTSTGHNLKWDHFEI